MCTDVSVLGRMISYVYYVPLSVACFCLLSVIAYFRHKVTENGQSSGMPQNALISTNFLAKVMSGALGC